MITHPAPATACAPLILALSVIIASGLAIGWSNGNNSSLAQNNTQQRVLPAGYSNDILTEHQWHLEGSSSERAGTGLRTAQTIPRQLDSVVVAVVDTGILSTHSDMGTVLPGYDFVSEITAANDGDGRDADATDPGDWVHNEDIHTGRVAEGCAVAKSSWHGTAVAGLLAANTDNAFGIAGAAPLVEILPVRVMGRCGGSVSDLIDGIRWAAGIEVSGAPVNPYPATVINLSLGFLGSCKEDMQAAIDAVRDAGAIVVAAVGNGGYPLSEQPYSPATCNGVITVAAADREGNFASYNNSGEAVDILAPGGIPGAGLTTLDDSGAQVALNDDSYQPHYGSSIAAPLVSATAALMIAANPVLQADEVERLIKNTARAVNDRTQCPPNSCGSGLLNAELAVHAANSSNSSTLPYSDDLYEEFYGGGGAIQPLFILLLLVLRQRHHAKISILSARNKLETSTRKAREQKPV